eukprot:12910058-Prorocentrum_lima.AAC.1
MAPLSFESIAGLDPLFFVWSIAPLFCPVPCPLVSCGSGHSLFATQLASVILQALFIIQRVLIHRLVNVPME